MFFFSLLGGGREAAEASEEVRALPLPGALNAKERVTS
jgi:hypothetical protein